MVKRISALAVLAALFMLLGSGVKDTFAQVTDVVYRKGIEYASEGKFKEAAVWFEDNLKNNKSDSTSISSLVSIKDLNDGKITEAYARSFFTGLNFLQNGKIDDGIKEFEGLIASNPAYPKTYNVLGAVYTSLGDKAKAVDYFKKAIEIDPKYAGACFNLGALYQSLAQPEDALKYYELAISLEPDSPDALMGAAVIYASLGKYPEAILYYKRIIGLDRNNAEAYYNLALAYFMSDQLAKFRESILKAQELYQQEGNAKGLEKAAVYIDKMKEIENKVRNAP